jgi:colicin import membrane protein
MTAEEWITDKEAVNKKNTKLLPISGKFRRKTIDRKDFLFNKFESLLK